MLELRPVCEHCYKSLPPDSDDAMVCSYECTFCKSCVEHVLHNVCPNCGGGFEKRPVRPKEKLLNDPATNKIIYKPVDMGSFYDLDSKYRNIRPEER